MSTTLTLAERAVPRYTSYPTAPHFSAAVGPQTYADWLAALPAAAKLSLYLHVPYCSELCLYYGCTTKAQCTFGRASGRWNSEAAQMEGKIHVTDFGRERGGRALLSGGGGVG